MFTNWQIQANLKWDASATIIVAVYVRGPLQTIYDASEVGVQVWVIAIIPRSVLRYKDEAKYNFS